MMITATRIKMSTEIAKDNSISAESKNNFEDEYQEDHQEGEYQEDYQEDYQEEYQEEYDEGMICAHCHEQEPMYPRKDSDDYCNILCADCFWDEDYREKHARSIYYALHPGEYEAYRKQAAETLGVKYEPLPQEWYDEMKEKNETREWYQRWVKPVLDARENKSDNQSESK